MIQRLLKWIAFSIGFALLPIIFSLIAYSSLKIQTHFSYFTSELLIMAVTLAGAAIGDLIELSQKNVKGLHITIMYVALLFIIIICIAAYVINTITSILKLSTDPHVINVLTIICCGFSLIIGIICQVYLELIEGERT